MFLAPGIEKLKASWVAEKQSFSFMPIVKCPRCGKETEYNGNEFRPFCSERCKLIDFGTWADEGFSLPAENAGLSEEDLEKLQKVWEEKQRDG